MSESNKLNKGAACEAIEEILIARMEALFDEIQAQHPTLSRRWAFAKAPSYRTYEVRAAFAKAQYRWLSKRAEHGVDVKPPEPVT